VIDLRTKQGWEDLKRILDDRVSDVLAMCGLEAPRRNGWTLIDDPRGDGRECFGICLRADGLAWKKFNGTEKGRALELIAYCHGWYDLPSAAPTGRQFCRAAARPRQRLGRAAGARSRRRQGARGQGGGEGHAGATRRRPRRSRSLPRPSRSSARRPRSICATRAASICAPPLHRPARRQHRAGLAALCGAASLRDPRQAEQRRAASTFAPALIACCTDADGQIRALHQTWLAADGSDKAAIPPAPDGTAQPARKVLGEFAGLVIPLWRGDGHLSVKDA
jgi:hypothetical protein